MLLLLWGLASAAEPPSHDLALVSVRTADGFEARVRNPAGKAVWLQITTPDAWAIEGAMRDEAGAAFEGAHRFGNAGRPVFSHRFERIEAGAEVPVAMWSYDDRAASARDNARVWDLRAHRGTKVQLIWTFSTACDARTIERSGVPALPGADNADPPGKVERIFCGSLVSKPAAFSVPPWTPARVTEGLKWNTVQSAEAYDALVAHGLTHDDATVRENAVVSLQQLGDRRAAAAIAERLGDPVREVRGNAARALGALGDRAVLPALQKAVASESDDWVKSAMFEAIQTLGG